MAKAFQSLPSFLRDFTRRPQHGPWNPWANTTGCSE